MDGAAAVRLLLSFVRAVWRVSFAEIAPSTPSGALLVDQATRAASVSACSRSWSLPLASPPQSLVPPRPGGSQAGIIVQSKVQHNYIASLQLVLYLVATLNSTQQLYMPKHGVQLLHEGRAAGVRRGAAHSSRLRTSSVGVEQLFGGFKRCYCFPPHKM